MKIHNDDGLYKLAAAVVKQARKDLRNKDRLEREEARRFFEEREGLFAAICAGLGREAEEVRERLRVQLGCLWDY